MDLNNRSILLTGAGSGIGRALVLELARYSPRLALVGRRSEPLEEVAALVRERGGEAVVIPADLTADGAPAQVVAAAQELLGGIDVLINNAGNVRAGRLEAIEESEVLAQIALNLSTPILLTRAALPALRASGEGLVVNVSSGFGLLGMAFYATYGATKAGIAHFGESMRRELHGEGVHVLNVFPGATDTPMMDSSEARAEHGFDYESPEEVAAATVAGMIGGELTVVRGKSMGQMITRNRQDPSGVDRMLAAGKEELEKAVAGHSSL
ncbi:SDR family oxidoreductase [uncultured Kocuria sp.]|uniref:SDR family NAD(P)-dependent oxidoreductase n=1 Tax=uncultured Kocuria sp. TaxID=259305 RepID=UPI002610001A|nr:SDR family NAD(P)-dependent oxidoreductase [uncultured Kocuria sp.]